MNDPGLEVWEGGRVLNYLVNSSPGYGRRVDVPTRRPGRLVDSQWVGSWEISKKVVSKLVRHDPKPLCRDLSTFYIPLIRTLPNFTIEDLESSQTLVPLLQIKTGLLRTSPFGEHPCRVRLNFPTTITPSPSSSLSGWRGGSQGFGNIHPLPGVTRTPRFVTTSLHSPPTRHPPRSLTSGRMIQFLYPTLGESENLTCL